MSDEEGTGGRGIERGGEQAEDRCWVVFIYKLFFACALSGSLGFSDPITSYSCSRCNAHLIVSLKGRSHFLKVRRLIQSRPLRQHVSRYLSRSDIVVTQRDSWLQGFAYSAFLFPDHCAILVSWSIMGLFCATDALLTHFNHHLTLPRCLRE